MLSFSSSHCVALSGSNPFTLLSAEYAQCNHRAISDHWVPPTLSPGHCCFFFGFLFWQFACFDIGPQSPLDVTFSNFIQIFWPLDDPTLCPLFEFNKLQKIVFPRHIFVFQPCSVIYNWAYVLRLNRQLISIFLVDSQISFSRFLPPC